MGEMYDVLSPETVREILMSNFKPKEIKREKVDLLNCVRRILAEPVISPVNLPGFCRSTMDGYAVRALDTHGATEGMPVYLKLTGEVRMGQMSNFSLGIGECIQVWTGGMLPAGADAVVMLEYTQQIGEDLIEVVRGVATGENTVREDEDVKAGEIIFTAGHCLRPQDIGALAGMGITEVTVYRQPRVGIISTGDEIIEPSENPLPGQIRDINTYSLCTALLENGCVPVIYGLAKDNEEELACKVEKAIAEVDCLLISGGSSAGARDITINVLARYQPGVLFHGISVRPGKPTIFADLCGIPVFGLPGHPVSAYTIFAFFVLPFLARLTGRAKPLMWKTVKARLSRNLPSVAGREDYIRVALFEEEKEIKAEPIFGKSALISTLVKADGVICIPAGVEGFMAGEIVTVYLYGE